MTRTVPLLLSGLLLLLSACRPDAAPSKADPDSDGDGTPDSEDCAPDNPQVHPDATEICNELDDDCDGIVDEDASWFPDADGDGFGDATASAVLSGCNEPPAGHVADATDCDDDNADAHPGGQEVCDEANADEDCDGLVDDLDDSVIGKTDHAPDADGDGHGDMHTREAWCDPPSGYTDRADDCDDEDPNTYPGAPEDDQTLLDDPACDGGGTARSLSGADHIFLGEADGDQAGVQVRTAGDVDGDGLDDILVTAAFNSEAAIDAGKVYLFLGRSLTDSTVSTQSLAEADFMFIGERERDYAGMYVDTAGDVDGDGLDDILIGSSHGEAGKAYVVLGGSLADSPTATIDLSLADYHLPGATRGDRAGWPVATAGDVDGDGLDDILIGAAYNDEGAELAGAVHLVLGSTLTASVDATLNLAEADVTFLGEDEGDELSRVSSAGDVDGDGLGDILMGSRWNSGHADYGGAAYLVLGSTLVGAADSTFEVENADIIFYGESFYDQAAGTLASAGDVDGDGLDDILIGAAHNDYAGEDSGRTYLVLGRSLRDNVSGRLFLNLADVDFAGEAPGDFAGGSLSSAGDLDRDGLDDIVVIAAASDRGGERAGAAYVWLGSTLSTSSEPTLSLSAADFIFYGEESFDYAGRAGTAGDVNGDGRDDLLIGAYGLPTSAGKAYLLLSSL